MLWKPTAGGTVLCLASPGTLSILRTIARDRMSQDKGAYSKEQRDEHLLGKHISCRSWPLTAACTSLLLTLMKVNESLSLPTYLQEPNSLIAKSWENQKTTRTTPRLDQAIKCAGRSPTVLWGK